MNQDNKLYSQFVLSHGKSELTFASVISGVAALNVSTLEDGTFLLRGVDDQGKIVFGELFLNPIDQTLQGLLWEDGVSATVIGRRAD